MIIPDVVSVRLLNSSWVRMRSSEKGRIPSAKPVQESVAYTGHTLRSFGKEKKSAKDCAAVLLWRDITLQVACNYATRYSESSGH